MSEQVLLVRDGVISQIPRATWETHLAMVPEHGSKRLAFMTADHHQVRYFAVKELPRYGRPIPPKHIAQSLGMQMARVEEILDELEQHLFFLFRNEAGQVEWAYPVTTAKTGHRLRFSSGEKLWGA